jgi:hypothetical protein
MKIETRVFNKRTKTMHYFKPLQARGDAVFGLPVDDRAYPELDATDPVMLKTSMQDINKEWLYEGDFVECGIQTSYGLIKDSGVVVWRADIGSFTINIKTPYENQTQFQVVDVIKKGNIYENPELLKNDKETDTKE